MKNVLTYSTLCAALSRAALAAPEVHHQHKRAIVTEIVYHTILVDQEGVPLSPDDLEPIAPTSVGAAEPPVAPTTEASKPPAAPQPEVTTSVEAKPEVSSPVLNFEVKAPIQSAAPVAKQPVSKNNGVNGDLNLFAAPAPFEDGTIKCSEFPAGNGVISLDWLGFGGWSGIQHVNGEQSATGDQCTEGAYCSYACQPGMSKTQWPTEQPANGVSVGGLQCRNGYLYRTNPSEANLCVWGADSAVVDNQLDEDVAICRTDYPGTENMVIPTLVTAKNRNILTVVDETSYYKWRNMQTSVQYYVNNAGVSVEDGCVWSTPGSGVGNWAPLNFGAGQTGTTSWLSLIPNPNNRSPLNYNVKIVPETPDSVVNGDCSYVNGAFNGGQDGCTVAVTKGRAKFVLYR